MFQYLKDEGLFGWNYRYLILHPWIIPGELYRRTKWFIQRGLRGYSDCDGWNIGNYLNSWLPSAIRNLKGGLGCPGFLLTSMNPTKEESATAYNRWQEMLEIMAKGFEAQISMDEFEVQYNTPEWVKKVAEADAGMVIFAKHYMSLWD